MLHADLVGRTVFQKLCGLAKSGDYSSFGAVTPTKPVSITLEAQMKNMIELESWKAYCSAVEELKHTYNNIPEGEGDARLKFNNSTYLSASFFCKVIEF